MARRTEGVYELVKDVLEVLREPYGEDVIEDVCLAIERSSEWTRRYNELCEELRRWVVNNWIGRHTKQLTGLKTVREVEAKRSRIITAYTKLAH